MKTLALLIALVSGAVAHGAVPSADVAEAPSAALAALEFAAEAAPPPPTLPETPGAGLAAVPDGVGMSETPDAEESAPAPCSLAAVAPSGDASPRIGALVAATASDASGIADMFTHRRMLSAPWSVSRRLRAARIRGDADEARRLEPMLEEAILKALSEEPQGAER